MTTVTKHNTTTMMMRQHFATLAKGWRKKTESLIIRCSKSSSSSSNYYSNNNNRRKHHQNQPLSLSLFATTALRFVVDDGKRRVQNSSFTTWKTQQQHTKTSSGSVLSPVVQHPHQCRIPSQLMVLYDDDDDDLPKATSPSSSTTSCRPVVGTWCTSAPVPVPVPTPVRRSFYHTVIVSKDGGKKKTITPPSTASSLSSSPPPPPPPPPSIVNIRPNSNKNNNNDDDDDESTEKLYAEWSQRYEHDVRGMGYDMPEQVAQMLVEHNILPPGPRTTTSTTTTCMKKGEDTDNDNDNNDLFRIVDVGCGDGLSGMALKEIILLSNKNNNGDDDDGDNNNSNFCRKMIEMIGADVTPEMLQIASTRGCYDKVVELNLNEQFGNNYEEKEEEEDGLWNDNSVDIVSCVGTMTYVDPNNGPCLDEFVRIVKPGGYIIYTNRTDRLEDFLPKETALENEGKWKLVRKKGPLPYLPGNPDYGTDIEATIFLFQVL